MHPVFCAFSQVRIDGVYRKLTYGGNRDSTLVANTRLKIRVIHRRYVFPKRDEYPIIALKCSLNF